MRRRLVPVALAAIAAALTFASPAFADLLITVDKSTQRMSVVLDGSELFNWPVSTGLAKYDTPNGSYMPFRMEKEHFSKEWDDAPMPHSVFFTKRGHAIHGTTHKNIGNPASHGCVRLEPKNAALLFDLVTQETIYKTKIVITGDLPAAPLVARGTEPRTPRAAETRRAAAPSFEQSFSNDDDEVTGSLPPVPPAYVPRREREPVYQERRVYPERYQRERVVRTFRGRDGRLYYYEEAPAYERPRIIDPRYAPARRYGYEAPPPGVYYYQR